MGAGRGKVGKHRDALPRPSPSILARLVGGDRRSIGRADQVAALVSKDPESFPELMTGLWSEDPLVRMRAADAAEKVSRKDPALLAPHKAELLGLMAEAEQQEMRWHLAAMVPRLALNANERQRAAASLKNFLNDRSSIVKTSALQGLADLARNDDDLRCSVIELLRQAERGGTPAMKARSRKLLPRLARASAHS
ncbi:MAG: hypothetical protein WB817_13790 [Terriglobales bacterium]